MLQYKDVLLHEYLLSEEQISLLIQSLRILKRYYIRYVNPRLTAAESAHIKDKIIININYIRQFLDQIEETFRYYHEENKIAPPYRAFIKDPNYSSRISEVHKNNRTNWALLFIFVVLLIFWLLI